MDRTVATLSCGSNKTLLSTVVSINSHVGASRREFDHCSARTVSHFASSDTTRQIPTKNPQTLPFPSFMMVRDPFKTPGHEPCANEAASEVILV